MTGFLSSSDFSSFVLLLLVNNFKPNLYFFALQVNASPALSERLQIFEALREKRGNGKRFESTEMPLRIRLVDGRIVKGTAGVTTPLYVARSVR